MMLIVNVVGVIAIIAIVYWFWFWFWLWQPRTAQRGSSSGAIDIIVANGVYKPDVIAVKRGDTLTLNFLREDASPCAEQVIFHGLDISETLPVGKTKTITLTPQKSGTYKFTCQMQMYQGTLQVLDS